MAQAVIHSGICGFTTTVQAHMQESGQVKLDITSDCKAVRKLATGLAEVDPYREFTFRGEGPEVLRLAPTCLSHAACPVPSGIIKAVEVAAGLALPANATIEVSRDEGA
jgi:hypothetical protein